MRRLRVRKLQLGAGLPKTGVGGAGGLCICSPQKRPPRPGFRVYSVKFPSFKIAKEFPRELLIYVHTVHHSNAELGEDPLRALSMALYAGRQLWGLLPLLWIC